MNKIIFQSKTKFLIVLAVFTVGTLFGQATNSNCETAINLGTLNVPGACPSGVGVSQSWNFTNIGAVGSNPYNYIPSCEPTDIIGSTPADVWFVFTAQSPFLDINITGGIETPIVTLYSGTCGNLAGVNCATGGGNTLSELVGNVTAGNTYFMQISGDNATDVGDFTLQITPVQDCADCVREHNLSVSPLPVNGTYEPGTAVTFCYTVSQYNQTNTNWMHGVVPDFGDGWDMSTLVTTNTGTQCSTTASQANGAWIWTTIPDPYSGGTITGYFYDYDCLVAMGANCTTWGADGDPTNNFGENCQGTGDPLWEWCWTVSTPIVCTEGLDLSMGVTTFGDGETGSWTSSACNSDPVWSFSSVLTCCAFPEAVATPPSCIGQSDGTATVTGLGTAPFLYEWTGPGGFNVSESSSDPSVQTGLLPGIYTVRVTDGAGCIRLIDVVVLEAADPCPCLLQVNAGDDATVCENGSIVLNGSYSNAVGTATVSWSPAGVLDDPTSLTPLFTPNATGDVQFILEVSDDDCTLSDVVTITVVPNITSMTCPESLSTSCDILDVPAYPDFAAFIAAGGSVQIPAGGAAVDEASFTLVSQVSDNNSCPETVTRTYQITDDCGVSVSCQQTIVIHDLIAPVFDAPPAAVTVSCISNIPAMVDLGWSDNCDGNGTVTGVDSALSGGTCGGTVTRTWTYTDACGNSSSVNQIITINDEIAPLMDAVPGSITVSCIADVPAMIDLGWTDNCDGNGTVTGVDAALSGDACGGTITRTWTYADVCGNSSSVSQIITINDEVNPTASNPLPIIVACASDVPAPNVAVVTDAADNCTLNPTVAWVQDDSDGNTCNGEIITRTYSVTDACGNSINVTQAITITSVTPTYTLTPFNPSACSLNDGYITLSGLNPNTDYNFSFEGGVTSTITTNGSGEYDVTGLTAGSYGNFVVSLLNCPACSTDIAGPVVLNDPSAPIFDVLFNANPTTCGGSDGSILIEGTGNLSPTTDYELTYSFNGVPVGPATIETDANGDYLLSGLTAGTYTNFILNLGGCVGSAGVSINLINPDAPIITAFDPVTACDSYTLLEILGQELTGNEAYYSAPGGNGDVYNQGDAITSSITLYAYDANGDCFDEEILVVTINNTPVLDNPGNQEVCGEYVLPEITGTNLSASAAYYNNSQANGGSAITGTITTSQTVWIYDANGTCSDEVSFAVTVNQFPVLVSITGNGDYCEGDAVQNVVVTVNGTPDFTLNYVFNGTAASVTSSEAQINLGNADGVYTLVSLDDNACSSAISGEVEIVVNPIPEAPVAGDDGSYCYYDDMPVLYAQSQFGGVLTWYSNEGLTQQVNTGTSLNQSAEVGTYTYYITETAAGCQGPATLVTVTIDNCTIEIPTAFTPDNDGVNDVWAIPQLSEAFPNNIVKVFNRWGNLIFESEGYTLPWDGTYNGSELPVASYYFIIEFNDGGVTEPASGTVSIIRNK